MNLLQEIRNYFTYGKSNYLFYLENLPEKYPGIVLRTAQDFGVAFEIDDEVTVSERFNKTRFYTNRLRTDKSERNYLILSSSFSDGWFEFASICAEFIEPGENGQNRMNIMADPVAWWKKWKELLGNRNSEISVYGVIAEMSVLKLNYEKDTSSRWTSPYGGSHDIESCCESIEVKSTIKRYDNVVTIAGQHQLKQEKNSMLWLYFCRMEESLEGVSIDDMVISLVEAGYEEHRIQEELIQMGFDPGASSRKRKYKILEIRKYRIDDSFPQITADSFRDGKIPDSIIRVEYSVCLDGIKYIPV